MGLQVWLSLNGNLNNQGLSDMTFSYIYSNGKLSVNNSGKIGKCYERTASGYNDLIRSNSKINLSEDITMMCWAYVSSTIGDTANGLITNHSHSNNTGVGITVKQVSTSDYRISCNTGTGSSRTYCSYYGTTNIKDSWHHLALTYSKSKKQLQLWVDGNVEYTLNNYINASQSDYIDLFNWSTTYYTSGDFRPVCKLNDVRVYDHCLTVKEVKEISKGLVCHYKLAGYGQENILSEHVVCGSNAPTSTSGGGRTSYYGSYGIGILAAENADTYFSLYTNKQLARGKVYTLSCIVSGLLNGTSYSFPLFAQGNGNMGNLVLNHNGLCSVTFTMNFTGSIPTSTDKYGNTIYRIFMDDNSRTIASGQTQFYATNFKLEEGSVVTPWCPNPSDTLYSTLGFNDRIEYDCSGYENNGTKVGTIAWSGDSARYSGSYGFDGNTNAIKTNFYDYTLDGIFTINMWFRKNTGEWSSKSYETLFGGQSGFEIESKNSSTNSPVIYAYSWGQGKFYYELDKWNMLTVVRTTSNTKWYLNGELKLTGTSGGIPSGNYYIGAWRTSAEQNYKGNISDFRVYATALSEADIKSLYNVSASIDKSGVLTAYEVIEN